MTRRLALLACLGVVAAIVVAVVGGTVDGPAVVRGATEPRRTATDPVPDAEVATPPSLVAASHPASREKAAQDGPPTPSEAAPSADRPPDRLDVHVRDAAGGPIENAMVTCRPRTGFRVFTDEDGVAAFELPAGVGGLTVAASHFEPAEVELDRRVGRIEVVLAPAVPRVDEPVAELEVRLVVPEGDWHGRYGVCLTEHDPTPSGTVTPYGWTPGRWLRSKTRVVDEHGRHVFEVQPNQALFVAVSDMTGTLTPSRRVAPVAAGERRVVELALESAAGALRGIVVDEDGAPVARAEVRIRSDPDDPYTVFHETSTGENGYFDVGSVLLDPVGLEIRRRGFAVLDSATRPGRPGFGPARRYVLERDESFVVEARGPDGGGIRVIGRDDRLARVVIRHRGTRFEPPYEVVDHPVVEHRVRITGVPRDDLVVELWYGGRVFEHARSAGTELVAFDLPATGAVDVDWPPDGSGSQVELRRAEMGYPLRADLSGRWTNVDGVVPGRYEVRIVDERGAPADVAPASVDVHAGGTARVALP